MGTATGLTAERMLEIENNTIVSGEVIDGQLYLTRKNGTQIAAGHVKGGPGDPGVSPITSEEWLEVKDHQVALDNAVNVLGGDLTAVSNTANTAAVEAADAHNAAIAANDAAVVASGIAEGKADVLIQDVAPSVEMQKSTTLWIDTTNSANTPKRWDGDSWEVVTDQVAIDAATTAADAHSAASEAQAAAASASSSAATAMAAATTAQTTADGKNKVTYSTSAPPVTPTGSEKTNDIWFRFSSNIVIGQWHWDGDSWEPKTIDNAVIANLDAAKITTGFMSANRLLISDLTNNLDDPGFQAAFGTSWYSAAGAGASIVTTTGGPGKAIRIQAGFSAQQTVRNRYRFKTIPNQSYTVSFRAQNFTNGVVTVGISWLDEAFGSISQSVVEIPAATAWADFSSTLTAPSGAFFGEMELKVPNTSTSGDFHFTKPTVRRRFGGELLVDGAVFARHIGSAQIETDHLKAGAVTASKMTITDSGNLVRNSMFELADENGFAIEWDGIVQKASTDPSVPANCPFPFVGVVSSPIGHSQEALFEVAVGDKFLVECTIANISGGSPALSVGLKLFNPEGDSVQVTYLFNIAEVPSPGVWYKFSEEITIPDHYAGYTQAVVCISTREFPPYLNSVWQVSGITISRKTSGKLIVDGAIDGMLITGATFQTAEEGNRIKIHQGTSGGFGTEAGVIEFWPNDALAAPGTIDAYYDSGLDFGEIRIRPPGYTSGETTLTIGKNSVNISKGLTVANGPIRFPGLDRSIKTRPTTQSIANDQWVVVAWTGNIEGSSAIPYTAGVWSPVDLDGLYLVTASVTFAANATGHRRIRLVSNDGSSDETLAIVEASALSGSTTSLTVTGFARALTTANVTFRIEVRHTAGSALDITPRRVNVIKLQ